MIIIIFCNFCNGPAVVAWSPLLYIFKWNVNLLYYCTHCNWTNRLSFLFSVFCEYFSKVQSVQTIFLTATNMHEHFDLHFVSSLRRAEYTDIEGWCCKLDVGVTGLLNVTECLSDVTALSWSIWTWVYMHWSLLYVLCVCACATGPQ